MGRAGLGGAVLVSWLADGDMARIVGCELAKDFRFVNEGDIVLNANTPDIVEDGDSETSWKSRDGVAKEESFIALMCLPCPSLEKLDVGKYVACRTYV